MIQQHWNKIVRVDYPPKVRDYITFGDLGKSYLDRYYKMKGEPITNPYEDRVLRIFDAGKTWEFQVLRVLTLAGLLNTKQQKVNISETQTSLPIYGFLDCTIGGFIDYEDAMQKITKYLQEYSLDIKDQIWEQKAISIIEGLKQDYPNGQIPQMLVEVKSINSMAFWAHKNRDEQGNFLGYPHNKLQLYGYMKATGIEKGILLYVSKDDNVIEELGLVLGDEKMEALFKEDTETMTSYIRTNTIPPKEEDIVWNLQKKTFELNWNIERSSYLTKITGLTKEEWIEQATKKANELNLEQKWLNQAKEHGFNVEGLTTAEIKKMCMARNREVEKLRKEKNDTL